MLCDFALISCDFMWFRVISCDSMWFHVILFWFDLMSIRMSGPGLGESSPQAPNWCHGLDFTWLYVILPEFVWFDVILCDFSWSNFMWSCVIWCDFVWFYVISSDLFRFEWISIWMTWFGRVCPLGTQLVPLARPVTPRSLRTVSRKSPSRDVSNAVTHT
jgi:hypothetical protein